MAPHVSGLTLLLFLVLVFAVLITFIYGLVRASRLAEDTAASTRHWLFIGIGISLAALLIPAALAQSGILRDFDRVPPPFLVYVVLTGAMTAALAFSPVGTRLADKIGWSGLIGFQVFRFPLEFVLYRLHQENVVPIQMTFAGLNFDILSGLSAGALALWNSHRELSRSIVLAWNLVGVTLLLIIVSIALLSAPTPFRAFPNPPANTFVAYFPYVWLPGVLVQAAWFGHILVFRRLLRTSSDRLPVSDVSTAPQALA